MASVLVAFFLIFSVTHDVAWYFGVLLAFVCAGLTFLICIILPLLALFLPLIHAAIMLTASILMYSEDFLFFVIALVALVSYIIRTLSMFRFVRQNPSLSRDYDAYLRTVGFY